MFATTDLGFVADDLTGACDVAACFAPTAGPVGVCLSLDSPFVGGPALQVVNTQSRLEDPPTAYRDSAPGGNSTGRKTHRFQEDRYGVARSDRR